MNESKCAICGSPIYGNNLYCQEHQATSRYTVSEILAIPEIKRLARKKRPVDAAKLLPIDKNILLWTQTNLTGMVLDVTTSDMNSWTHIPKMNGYVLETNYGKALLENVGPLDNLRKILDMLGPEGLQYTLATLAHIEDHIRRKYGTPPESRNELTPIKIVVSDLLRTMGRQPSGNTFHRDQQLKPRRFLKAQSMVEYVDIKPTQKNKTVVQIGPLINMLGTEFETCLPFEDITDAGEVVSITVLPGEAVYEHMRKGIRWCHPQLVKYHPSRQKYEIAIGFYLGQLSVNRRNKPEQEYVALGSIERGSGVDCFDKNISRRLIRIEETLNRLAEDGIIPGVQTPGGKYKAITVENNNLTDPIEKIRTKKVKVVHAEVLANGYQPMLNTSNQP